MIAKIKAAFEKRLMELLPLIDTAYEAASFKPQNNVPYQRVQLVPRKPENPTMGDSYYREVGEFQIFLAYPSNKGTAEVLARANLVQQHFARGTTIVESGVVVNIIRTPHITGSSIAGDRVVVPVIIQYIAEAV